MRKVSNGNPNWNSIPNRAQPVIDVKEQALYWLDAWSSPMALIKVNLKNGSITPTPLPQQYAQPAGGDHEVYLVFDPSNRVLLIPNNFDMGPPRSRDSASITLTPGGENGKRSPWAVIGSVWGLDEVTGAMIGISKRLLPFACFLYKYARGPRYADRRAFKAVRATPPSERLSHAGA